MAEPNRQNRVDLRVTTSVAPPQPWHTHIKPSKYLKYSSNWNGKLNTKYHTTIRLQKGYYKVGEYIGVKYAHQKENEYLFKGLVHKAIDLKLNQLTEVTAYLDTGYNLDQTRALFMKMYPGTDWSQQILVLLLIENIEY